MNTKIVTIPLIHQNAAFTLFILDMVILVKYHEHKARSEAQMPNLVIVMKIAKYVTNNEITATTNRMLLILEKHIYYLAVLL